MRNLEQYLYDRVVPVISGWNEEGIYAISFFVYSNEAFTYHDIANVSEFSISYNTETDCENAPMMSEERWNYAFWRQDEEEIIIADDQDEGMGYLFDWYRENNITDIGYEGYEPQFDPKGNYIGKGPYGHYELVCAVSSVARRIQHEGIVLRHFGHPIPIIVHGLEYAWFDIEATTGANPFGEADAFLEAYRTGLL